MKSIFLWFILALLAFELIEHGFFPLICLVRNRKRRPICGADGMPGKVGVIRYWHGSEGKILVNGELWQAIGRTAFREGDMAVVHKLNGLTLSVEPCKEITRKPID